MNVEEQQRGRDELVAQLVERVDELADAVGRFLRAHRDSSCCRECWVSHVETSDDVCEGDEWGHALHGLWVAYGDDELGGEG